MARDQFANARLERDAKRIIAEFRKADPTFDIDLEWAKQVNEEVEWHAREKAEKKPRKRKEQVFNAANVS